MTDTQKKAEIESIESGKGLDYILNEAYKIMGNPLVIHDMEYKLLACTQGVETDDALWNELVENGVFSEETIEFFSAEEFIDIVASTEKVAMLRSDKLKYDRLYGRVLNSDNSTVADMALIACKKPLEESDMVLFEVLTERLSQEISADSYFQQYGVLYHDDLICRLIENNTGDRIIYSDHVANLYEGLKARLFIAVAEICSNDIKMQYLEDLRDAFKNIKPEFKYAVYSDYIVMLISTDDENLDYEKEMKELNILIEQNNIKIGISSCFDNLFEFRKYYNEAVESLGQRLSAS